MLLTRLKPARKNSTGFLLAAVLSSMATHVGATNLHFLKYDPVSQLKTEDWELEGKAFLHAVNNGDAGLTVPWSNDASGNSGSITVLDSFTGPQGQPCRKIEEIFKSRLLDSRYTLTVCQVDDDWRTVSANR
jgi:surface antigen